MKNPSTKSPAKACAIVSALIIVVALVLTIVGSGLNTGIDFSGGISMRYDMGEAFSVDTVRAALTEQGIADAQISAVGGANTQMQLSMKDVENSDTVRAALEAKLHETYPKASFISVARVGVTAGQDMLRNALIGLAIALILLLIYVAIRFDFFFGMAAGLGVVHDVLIVTSVMVILRGLVQVNFSYIAALLVVVAYSLNNTIVVLTRINDNSSKSRLKQMGRKEIVALSVKESRPRMLIIAATTLLVVVLLYILGVAGIKAFMFPMIIGMLSGYFYATMMAGYVWASMMDRREPLQLKHEKV